VKSARRRRRTLKPWTWQWVAVAFVFGSAVIAAALGFDDFELSQYQLDYGRLLATVLGGAAVFVSALRYIWERQQELAWRRTEFMAHLFQEFEETPAFKRARELIDDAYDKDDDQYLARVLGSTNGLDGNEMEDRRRIDRYLDFFDHLYTYTFITRTVSADEAVSFSGYVIDILDSQAVSDFCIEIGYEDVLWLALYYRDRAEKLKRAEQTDELKKEIALKRRR
jgi:hypothetical protein